MNWQEKFVQIIMKQYPKSIALMRGNFKSSQIWKLQYMSNPRLLYDFFDEQGIYINIARWEEAEVWAYRIIIGIKEYISFEITHPTRTEAEEQAFIKAFEILEDKL